MRMCSHSISSPVAKARTNRPRRLQWKILTNGSQTRTVLAWDEAAAAGIAPAASTADLLAVMASLLGDDLARGRVDEQRCAGVVLIEGVDLAAGLGDLGLLDLVALGF